jgi:hypothetical protein
MGAYGGPDIITEGLVLALDAASERSYPGTGTSWYDLTKESNNGSLINGPSFSNDNYGVIDFDGVNDWGFIVSSPAFTVNTRTVEIIFRMNGSYSNYSPLAVYANGSSTTNRIWLGVQANKFRMHGWGTEDPICTTTIDSDEWYVCTFSYNKPTQAMKVYTNGVLEGSLTNSQGGVSADSSNNWYLASIPGGWQGVTYSDTSIASFKIYDRILSDDEVLQNYNAIKNRFI